jgi:hypothetical protein
MVSGGRRRRQPSDAQEAPCPPADITGGSSHVKGRWP